VVEKAGVLDRLIAPVLAAAKSAGALVASLVGSVFATNVVTADQYIALLAIAVAYVGVRMLRGPGGTPAPASAGAGKQRSEPS
jgi:Na+:H+ antiporter, NhaC family